MASRSPNVNLSPKAAREFWSSAMLSRMSTGMEPAAAGSRQTIL